MQINTNFLTTLGRAITLILALAMGGCAMVPGANISEQDVLAMNDADGGTVHLIPITPALINAMRPRKAWTIQVATYVDESNARKMQKNLLSQGLNATAKSVL